MVNDVDHTKSEVTSVQTNRICSRLHRTVLQGAYQVTFRQQLYRALDELQAELDVWTLK